MRRARRFRVVERLHRSVGERMVLAERVEDVLGVFPVGPFELVGGSPDERPVVVLELPLTPRLEPFPLDSQL